jgi:tripartite-type tricarboxylate transporter receptor subunit TctC
VFSTNLAYLMPMITKVGYRIETMTPVAIMAADEFLLWSNADGPYKDAKGFIDAARAKPGSIKMGGAQSKDTDHILTRQIEMATDTKMVYVPFKSGSEVAVQLSGGHVDANVNNPSENIAHWRAGKVQPLCAFAKERLKIEGKVRGDKGFGDVPTCKESGIAIEHFNMPRTVWAAGGLKPEQVKYFENVMAQVREKPEFKEWLARGLQTDLFLVGQPLADYIAADGAKNKAQFAKDDWLVK